ncbi:MAG: DUF2189 domain-containing protein [Kiloniellales bacterium]
MAETTLVSALQVPKIRKITGDNPWQWLRAGWQDIQRAPRASLLYGLLFAIVSYLLTALIWVIEAFYLVLPLAAGFMLIGPILCVGLYDISRRLEKGEPVSFLSSLAAWRRNMSQIALMGLALTLFLLAWLRFATLLFAFFFSGSPPRPEPLFLLDVFVSAQSLPFLATGTVIGGVLAALAFAISVVSIPLLLDRDANVISAIAASVETVRQNFWPMMLWAWLIVLFVGAGIATGYLGLIVTLPLIGHASWHAYRDLVSWEGD